MTKIVKFCTFCLIFSNISFLKVSRSNIFYLLFGFGQSNYDCWKSKLCLHYWYHKEVIKKLAIFGSNNRNRKPLSSRLNGIVKSTITDYSQCDYLPTLLHSNVCNFFENWKTLNNFLKTWQTVFTHFLKNWKKLMQEPLISNYWFRG